MKKTINSGAELILRTVQSRLGASGIKTMLMSDTGSKADVAKLFIYGCIPHMIWLNRGHVQFELRRGDRARKYTVITGLHRAIPKMEDPNFDVERFANTLADISLQIKKLYDCFWEKKR